MIRKLFFVLLLWLSLATHLSAAPIRVMGRVLDETEEAGVAGARVELFPAYQGSTPPAPLASARTDAEGFFEIAAPEDGCFRLVVRAEGYATMEHPLAPLVEDRQLPTVSLLPSKLFKVTGEDTLWRALGSDHPGGWRPAGRLASKNETPKAPVASTTARPVPPRRISGKVTSSASGKPVAGALVWSGWPPVSPPVRANEEGRFQLEVPPGDGLWLETAAAGFLPAERRYVPQQNVPQQYVPQGTPQTTAPVLVKLDPAAEISGKVSDSAGRPVGGVSIQLHPPRAIDQYEESSGAWAGADGRFRLTGLKPGSAYKLTARHKGFEPTSVTARTSPTGQPPPPSVQIVLGEGKTVRGRVVDAEGRPAAGVEILLLDLRTFRDRQEATTGKEGRFEIRHLSPGTYTLLAQPPDRAGLELPEVEIPSSTPSVDLGDLKLPAAGAIEGRVTDTRGTPIEGAEVNVAEAKDLSHGLNLSMSLGDALMAENGLQSARTGPDGIFSVPGLKSGARFDLRVQHPGYAEAKLAGVEAPTQDPVQIELKAGHRLAGRVVDTEGEPVAGASLIWIERTEGIAGLIGSQRPLGESDAEGRFRADGLPAGSLDLEVKAEGYQTRWLDGLRIPEDGDLEDVQVVLGRGSWLDVQVLNAEGEPLPDTFVFAQPQDLDKAQSPRALMLRTFGHCQTDSRGRCRLSLPEPGAYTVKLSPAAATVNVTAPPGGTSVEIRLPRGFEVSGRVIGKDGAGVPEVYVQSLSETQESSAANTGADGSFVFPGLPDGKYRLAVRQTGYGKASLDVEVMGQPVRGLELRLSPETTAVLTGRLTGLPPEELTGATIEAMSSGGYYIKSGRVERDGAYRIDDLEPGEWVVSAGTGSGRQVEGRVRIEPGATAATLDLDFAAGLMLSGRVLVDGSPTGGANVMAGNQDAPGSGRLTRTAYDGSFILRDLPPGPLTVGVIGAPGISAIRKLQLDENREITIEITTGTFKATVLSATGEPLEGAVATLEPRDPDIQVPFAAVSARSGPDGTLDAGRLAPGTYRMEIRRDGFQPRQETVEIRPGGATVMEVRLRDLLP